ncbi:pseudaminic acid synthase [Fontisphaera persica]|uniref:pseudaminic acid synthase n=1 Tax=Fontisphaera persica TaxID=2974023 RepID=UPI0024BFF061|nr:pseudaminic acid synthase [Fontisphaera persica]WCJ58882.1 pseudaminic acid synthase [Fontisphaera persica]
MNPLLHIAGRPIGPGHPVYIIAELSANHGGNFEQAAQTLRAMKAAGADAVKIQTYTADTLTLASDQPWFRIQGGTLWDGRTLHELYQQAAMPWEWTPRLQALAQELGLHFFSTPFDFTAVDFLQQLDVPAYKIASFELVDLPLLRKVAATGKPVIASTGMATLEEITEAVETLRAAGCRELALLKCTSAYPAPPEEMHLRTLADLARRFQLPVGLSDHTLGLAAPVAAVALGACILEKHFILSRSLPGPDSAFSLEPAEFRAMVQAVRDAERALGEVNYTVSPQESKSRQFRRSLFVVADMRAGDTFTPQNVRSLRPAAGLHPRHYDTILGRRAACDIPRGTPLQWDLIASD